MADLIISEIMKSYGENVALDSVSLEVADGELVALLGASGCGKTTMLRVIAGFEEIDSGLVRSGNRIFSSSSIHLSAEKRKVGVVFQSYALWPHMSVAGNVGYPLKVAGKGRREIEQTVLSALDCVGLSGLDERSPAELSGGQRQRVALARCLVMEPDVMLLDEPLANLDVHLREAMLQEFKDFHLKTKATMIFVTHDQSEAMAIADRIAVMDSGRLVQFSSPRELYDCPATSSVARFIGQGSVIPVEVRKVKKGRCLVSVGDYTAKARCSAEAVSGNSFCALKAEWLILDKKGFECTILRSVYIGGQTQVELQITGMPEECDSLRVNLSGFRQFEVCEKINIGIKDGWVIPE